MGLSPRRFFKAFVLCLALQAGAGQTLCGAIAYQADSAHDGAVTFAAVSPVPTPLWSVDTGSSSAYPIIAGGQVFVNGGGHLHAYDALTGLTRWNTTTPGGTTYTSGDGIAYDNGRIFLVSFTPSHYSMLAYNALTGLKAWETALPVQYSFSSPVSAGNGSAYVGGAGNSGTVYSVRQSDGLLQWSATVHNGDNSSPAVTNEGVYVNYAGPQTYKLNVANGQQVWHYSGSSSGGGGTTPVYHNGKLFISDIFSTDNPFNQLQALDASNGAPLYSTISGNAFQPISPPAFFNNTGYIDYKTELRAFNEADGSILWTKTFNDGSTSVSAPLVINGNIYQATSAGKLYVLDGSTGATIGTVDLGATGMLYGGGGFNFYTGMAAADGLLAVPIGSNLVVLSLPEPTTGAMAGVILLAFHLALGRRRARRA